VAEADDVLETVAVTTAGVGGFVATSHNKHHVNIISVAFCKKQNYSFYPPCNNVHICVIYNCQYLPIFIY